MKKTTVKAFCACFLSSVMLTCSLSQNIVPVKGAVGVIKFTSSSTINSTYQRLAAARYAVKYAKYLDRNTNYETYINGAGGDCTNFVSQVLHENIYISPQYYGGTLPFHGTRGYNRFEIDWYYYGPNVPENTSQINTRTSTWTGAHQFRQHWGMVNSIGGKLAYQMKVYTMAEANNNIADIYNYVSTGDIVQYSNNQGVTGHSQVIHGFSSNYGVRVAQHSDDPNIYTWDSGLDLQQYISAFAQDQNYYNGWFTVLKIKNN